MSRPPEATISRIETGADYIESLRGRRLTVFLFGERVAELKHAMVAHLAVHEALLAGRDYLLGDVFSAADCASFPFLKYALKIDPEDDELFHRILHENQPIDPYPRLRAWIAHRAPSANPRRSGSTAATPGHQSAKWPGSAMKSQTSSREASSSRAAETRGMGGRVRALSLSRCRGGPGAAVPGTRSSGAMRARPRWRRRSPRGRPA